jgi:exonuclease III
MTLKIMHHNIRGLENKLTELTIMIDEHKPDIITLNESLQLKTIPKIHDYDPFIPDDYKDKGVIIYCRKELQAEITNIRTTDTTKNLTTGIKFTTTNNETIHVITLYCPTGNPNINLLNTILNHHDNIILTGDFNVKHEDIGYTSSNKQGRTLIEATAT